jgi:hypothetical protein
MAAARTPASVLRESMGSRTLLVVKFTDVVTGDTWVSGLGTSPVAWWITATTAPGSQTNCGIMASFASGTFTMIPDEDTQDATLFVMV